MPKRIQRKRTKGWKMPDGAVYVGRGTRWGNPFRAVAGARYSDLWDGDQFLGQSTDPEWAQREAVERFSLHVGPMGNHEFNAETLAALRRELGGRDLACWCGPDRPCHADVLLEMANTAPKPPVVES